MSKVVVSALKIKREGKNFRLCHKLQGLAGVDKLEYLVEPENYKFLPVSNSDHALIALLYPAMLAGKALHFEGVVGNELLFKVRNNVMPLLTARDKRLKSVEITADKTVDTSNARKGAGVGTGYSAGVDSFATLELYSEKHAPASHSVSHLALFDNTSNDIGEFPDGLETRAHTYSTLRGLPLTKISSNIETVISSVETLRQAESYRQSHSIRSAASASILANVLDCYVFSGSYDYRFVTTDQTIDMAYVDPMLMPALSTSAFELVSGCAGMRRLEKTLMIADNEDAKSHLHICIRRTGSVEWQSKGRGRPEFINCSSCWKCVRTMFTLEIAGKLEEFAEVFDLDYFDAHRYSAVNNLRQRARDGDGQAWDALAYAKQNGGLQAFVARRLSAAVESKGA